LTRKGIQIALKTSRWDKKSPQLGYLRKTLKQARRNKEMEGKKSPPEEGQGRGERIRLTIRRSSFATQSVAMSHAEQASIKRREG